MFLRVFSSSLSGTGWLEYAGVGYYPFPNETPALIKPQRVRLWLTSFPWGQVLLRRTRCSGVFQNGSFSFSPAGNRRGFFSYVYCGNLVELLVVNFTIMWALRPPWLSHPVVFNFQSCPPWASSDLSIPVQIFLPQHWFPQQFRSWVSAQVSCDSRYCLSLQSRGQWFVLCALLSYGSKKNGWFFILFRFLLIVRMKWWLPSSI